MPGGTDRLLVRTLLFGAGPGTLMVCGCRVVFGTLLGPEATGLSGAGFGLFPGGLFVSGFLAALIAWLPVFGGCVWGVWYGVVV